MKKLKTYIIEGIKYFTLEKYERMALADFVGILCGNIGEDSERKPYKALIDSLTPEEMKQLSLCHDCLDDTETYKAVNRNNLKDDIKLLNKVLEWAWERDLMDENWDLQDAYGKLQGK